MHQGEFLGDIGARPYKHWRKEAEFGRMSDEARRCRNEKNKERYIKVFPNGKIFENWQWMCHTGEKEVRLWLSVKNTWISCGHGRMSSR